MESDADSDEDGYFGQQQVPLTDEIKEILEEYPDGQIFKEIIQNADDARAREVKFFIDERSHGQQNLLHRSLAKFQGPALLAYNDAVFTDEDWTNIQKLKRSNKRSDPFKVGKFGIGFNSVFHVTDLPTIVSGKWMCFMDPQKTIWKGDPGHKCKLTSYKLTNSDSCTPFIFDHHCSLELNSSYPGTIIRLPLRNSPSEISSKQYTMSKLKSLLSALKKDAEILLLFLRHVESIKVYTIDPRGKVAKIFGVEADTSSELRREMKTKFLNEVEEYHANSTNSVLFPCLQCEVTITVQDSLEKSNCQWLVMNCVGSPNKEILELSNRILNLPWLGIAVPLTSPSPSRLFCFLPMPDSEEINPPLPVCVHGTFGLTKDRRHLKWKTSDMQNDDGALWNDLLLSKMLPSCYCKCLCILKDKYEPDMVYSFWPNVSMVGKTNWKVLLTPLLSQLLHEQLFWAKNGCWIKFQPSVYVVPEAQRVTLTEVVITALIKCGQVVVELPSEIWKAVKLQCSNKVYPFTVISPCLVRQALRDHLSSYVSMSRDAKLELLHYCLDDDDFNDLTGLQLLPTTDNVFQTFKKKDSRQLLYIYSLKFLKPQLLAGHKSELVNLEAEDKVLHNKLQLIAEKSDTQLQALTLEVIAKMLENDNIFRKGYCSVDSTIVFNNVWLNQFWRWVKNHSLSPFVSIPLAPISNNMEKSRFKTVPLLNKDQSQVIQCSKNDIHDDELITASEKLGCCMSFTDDFKYFYHQELHEYVHDLSVSSLLEICSKLSVQHEPFTFKEAKALRTFLFQRHIELTKKQSNLVIAMRIFPAVQSNTLYSLSSAKTTIEGKTNAIMIAKSDFPSDYKHYMPAIPVILTCSGFTIKNLQSMLPKSVWSFTKAELTLFVMLPAIKKAHLSRDEIIKYTSVILEPKEYYSLISSPEGDDLVFKLQSLKFLPTNESGPLLSPSEVCDPSDDTTVELFRGQEVYPVYPYVEKYFPLLRELGMKTSDDLNSQDIDEITDIVSSQFASNIEAEIRRANKLLQFLSSTKGCKLLPLEQTLCSKQWLPVMVTPPKEYPNCLCWKGATGSQFVSPQDLHACGSLDDHKDLPYLIGSQVKILECDRALSAEVIEALCIPNSIPLNAMILHYLELVRHKTEIKTDEFEKCIGLLYKYLELAASANHYCEKWESLRQSEVVQVKDDKFVKPSLVACTFDDDAITVGKLEPYLYTLPNNLFQYKNFFCYIGVKNEITKEDVLRVLGKISRKPNNSDWKLVHKILTWLCKTYTSTEIQQLHNRLFVPVSSDMEDKLLLKSADQVAFLNDDLNWLRKSKKALKSITVDYFLVHSSISYDMACNLQLKPLNTMIAHTEEFFFEQAGQSEPLTTRLNRILKEYKDTSVIQELIQNADDAEATEVAVYLDTRKHDSSNLFFPGMANSYGPALLFYNNAEFNEEDFENIRKIAGETKINKPLKIGKFGVGFCSAYHITDVPSFVSGENFVVFDPTLQCLEKEIKSKFNPGIKINFHRHYLLNKSNQLDPYTGISEFDPEKHFEGTLFRFPLRVKKSKISEAVYTTNEVQLLLNRVKENSTKLLMFLSNVKKITIWQSEGDTFSKDFEVIASKPVVPGSNNVISYKVTSSASHGEENWLIATNSQQLQTGDSTQNHGTASVAIKLNVDEQSRKFYVEPILGECFCYLPLDMMTGLPVHVSSNFAVMTNRRGIWKGDNINTATKESNWNEMLMKSVVFKSYIELLLHLKTMQQNDSLVNYTFYCLWPINTREMNPWNILIKKFYDFICILSNTDSLFYSKITNSWKSLNECYFLSPKIFPSVTFQKDLYSSINQVIAVHKIPQVDLTDEIWKILSNHDDFCAQIIGEDRFIRFFYRDQILKRVPSNDKSVIVAASLITYANESYDKSLPKLIKSTKCIPCCPDGKVFKQPMDTLDPKSQASKLFLPSDHMWPDSNFLKQSGLLHKSLLDLGMNTLLPWNLVVDRAKHMQNLFNDDRKKSSECLIILLECINKILSTDSPVSTDSEKLLKSIPFLPVMKKPLDYPLTWKGDSNTLLCGPKLTARTCHYSDIESINAIYACGSQVPILDSGIIPVRILTNRVLNFLGITKNIREIDVANHFNMLVQHFQAFPTQNNFLPTISCIVKEVYKYWAIKINQKQTLKESVRCIKDKPCIWNESQSKFLHPSCVSLNWKLDGPFLYKFPAIIPPALKPLMKELGVKHAFPSEVLLEALYKMEHQYKNIVLPEECQATVQLILHKLRSFSAIDFEKKIFLPDENFILREVEHLRYNDMPWCIPDRKFLYCHGSIERSTAVRLGVVPVRVATLEDIDITDEWFDDFGQEEKLTIRLNNILRDYPRDITFLKEMLQNADDANATKLFVILDKRFHSKEKVLTEEWKQLQGPAILIWNNSTFSKDDLNGIQKIGLGSKRDDADKIGQYGIGFNVVYHFTDCPSFITDNKLCIFDPHYRYVVNDKGKKPGRLYKDLSTIWNKFPGLKSPYLQNDLDHFPEEMKMSGSLFRFPLRLNEDMAKQSEIIQNVINLQELEHDLKEWLSEVREALLFLRNINDVRLFIIDETTSKTHCKQRIDNRIKLHFHASSNKDQEKVIIADGNAKLMMFSMTLYVNPETSASETKWLVQLGEGDVEDSDFDWTRIKLIRGAHPRHGIAAPIDSSNFQGKSFCFLPLPCKTNLPVHIHGQFVLHSDRRGIWFNSSGSSSNTSDDPKTKWNVKLCHAISAAYAHFLINCIERKETPSSKDTLLKSLQNYYNLFPNPNVCNTVPWLHIASSVYIILSGCNASILATLVKHDKPFVSRSSHSNDEFVIKWYKLHQPDTIDEPHFYSNTLVSFSNVLKSIGMNITDTPMTICEWFNGIDQEDLPKLPIISRKSVIQYYIRFSFQICNSNLLPCNLSSTKFCDITHFITFLKYFMLSECKFSEETEGFIKSSVGLIVTADGKLHGLSDGREIISSCHWKLFPNSSCYFVHDDLRELYPSYSKYLMRSTAQNSLDQFNHISSILANNIPFKWNGETQVIYLEKHTKWIQDILNCIANDPTIGTHCNKLLEKFPLLPADNGRVYSLSSNILPLRNVFDDNDNYDIADTKKLMIKLKVPLLRHNLLNDILDEIDMPSMLIPENILKTLYVIETCSSSLLNTYKMLSTDEYILLFKILKLISYSHPLNQKHIEQLPIFTTINKKLVSLASSSEVWIWDDQQVCLAGMDQWINHISSNVVFLDPSAPWACLMHEAQNLKMCVINKYDVYCKFVFPNFHYLDSDAQSEHLGFILKNVYPHCEHLLKFPNDINITKLNDFIAALKSLPCIRDSTGTLRNIGYFYDHKEPLFKAFCSESCFLPISFRSQKWHVFFKYFGLKTSPTAEEFKSYCKQLSNFGTISAIKTGSKALLNVLLDVSRSAKEKYKSLYSYQYLKEVSQIPIAIVEKMPDLDCIKEQKMGELVICNKNSSLSLTKMCGSSLVTNKNLVWTVLPLIEVPIDRSELFCERLQHLGIIQAPSVQDVLSNLHNISASVFANFDRFEKLTSSEPLASKSANLPAIIVAIIKYLLTNLKQEPNFEDLCNQLAPKLSNLKFFPVKLPVQSTEEYALVKPTQVLCMEQHEVEPFYPFLHPLIDEASGFYKFLSNFGVKRSITFCHVQLVLQLAKELCQNNEVDENFKHVIYKITQQLLKLLEQTDNKSAVVGDLKPLYLLSEETILTECSKLVVCDTPNSRHFPLPTGYAYLNMLKDIEKPGITRWPYLLPKELELKSLKSITTYQLMDGTPAEDVSPNVSVIKDILVSREFKKAIEIFASLGNQGVIPQSVTDILTNFQSRLTVQYLIQVQAKPKLNLDDKVIPLDVTVQFSFFLQKSVNHQWILSLNNTDVPFSHAVFLQLSNRLCSDLHLKSKGYFKVTDNNRLVELSVFISHLLQCNSISKISEVIKMFLPGVDTIDIEMEASVDRKPALGDLVPKRLHDTLDQSLFNLFYPEEWVGFEKEDGTIVYAQILCEEPAKKGDYISKSRQEQMMGRQYEILIGLNEEVITIPVVHLYKFVHIKSTKKDSGITEVIVYDGPSTSKMDSENKKAKSKSIDKKTIKEAIKAAFALPEEQRRRAIKRLYLHHHPDKNPDNPNATAEFQFLQQEIKRMDNHEQTGNSTWQNWFREWNRTASSHREFRSRCDESSYGHERPSGQNIPQSQPDLNEAKLWIGQAKYDYSALCVLKNASKTVSEVSAATCFMCHEVTEKSLKAGLYATRGMSEVSLKKHNLISLASALIQMNFPLNIEDAEFLEGFYLDTRFPNRYNPHAIPGEKFASHTAMQGFEAATRIYETVKQMIDE